MNVLSYLTSGSKLDRIILVTVSHSRPWIRAEQATDIVRATALKEKQLRHMLQKDCQIMYYDLSPGSASKIIRTLTAKRGRLRLSFTDALVEFFKTARNDLEQVWQKLKTSMKDTGKLEESDYWYRLIEH